MHVTVKSLKKKKRNDNHHYWLGVGRRQKNVIQKDLTILVMS